MREYPSKVDAAPGFASMEITLRVFDEPLEIMRDFWSKIGDDEKTPTDEELLRYKVIGVTGGNEEIEHTVGEQIQGVTEMGMWGFADVLAGTISVWFEEKMDSESIMHMLAHELGHIAIDRYGQYIGGKASEEDTIMINGLEIPPEEVFTDLFGWVSRQCLAWCVLIQSQSIGDTGEIEISFEVSETDDPN